MVRESAAGRIADAATAILTDEGPDAVTMRRVAAEAGVSTMATYKHFPHREALLNAVADAGFEAMVGAWGRRRGGGSSFEARLGELLDDLLDFALTSPHLYRFLMFDRREGARRFPEGFREHPSPTFQPVLTLVEEAVAAGNLRDDDPLEMTLVLTSSAQGLIHLFLSGRMGLAEADFRALCHRTIERAVHGLAP